MTSRIGLETKYGKIIRATPQASGTTVFWRLPYTKKPSPIEPNSNPQRRDDVSNAVVKRLTMRLSGRTQARPMGRERRITKRARGAQPPPRHGPLEPMVRQQPIPSRPDTQAVPLRLLGGAPPRHRNLPRTSVASGAAQLEPGPNC